MATPRCCALTSPARWPSIRTVPASGSSSPAIWRSKVVLPEPEPPNTTRHSPRPTPPASPASNLFFPQTLPQPSAPPARGGGPVEQLFLAESLAQAADAQMGHACFLDSALDRAEAQAFDEVALCEHRD